MLNLDEKQLGLMKSEWIPRSASLSCNDISKTASPDYYIWWILEGRWTTEINFDVCALSHLMHPAENQPRYGLLGLSPLLLKIIERRSDLQAAFALNTQEGIWRALGWFFFNGMEEYKLFDAVDASLLKQLDAPPPFLKDEVDIQWGLNWLMYFAWLSSKELRGRFDLRIREHREEFKDWYLFEAAPTRGFHRIIDRRWREWLAAEIVIPGHHDQKCPRIAIRMWSRRTDLQTAFDLSTSEGCKSLKNWCINARAVEPALAWVMDAIDSAEPSPEASKPVQGVYWTETPTLAPNNQLEKFNSSLSAWYSSGEDPNFSTKFIHPLLRGWYEVNMEIHVPQTTGQAKIYVDYGNGLSENDSYETSYVSGSRISRLVFMPNDAAGLRFDPATINGILLINEFTVSSVSPEYARTIVRERLSLVDDQLWPESSFAPAKELLDKYEDSFKCKDRLLAYHDWIETVETAEMPTQEEIAEILRGELAPAPLISVIIPTYNTEVRFLQECIDSVIAQSYPHWELCIADDASPNDEVRAVLLDYQNRDARIRTVFRKRNGHISRASNSALKLARGEYVALLDHDDKLAANALLFVARAIVKQPDLQILYSDEDKISITGERFDPHFKSDWNPDLILAQNYVSHLSIFRRTLLRKVGAFRSGVEGSQDYDILLRCLKYVKPGQILHLPHVLYHWRSIEGSTASGAAAKEYTTQAGLRALKDYIQDNEIPAAAMAGVLPNTYRVAWDIPAPPPLVSLLIPTRDRRALTECCVRSILNKTTYPNYEILILDNGSIEAETLEFFEEIQKESKLIKVLRYDYPFNYSAINNFGAANSRGSILGLINNDLEVINPEWLTEMVSHAVRPNVGCVGAKLYYADDRIQHAGVILGIGGVAGHSHKYYKRNDPGYFSRLALTQNLSAVTAACLIIRREVFMKVGGLDEQNLAVAFNDVDFCLKVRQLGLRNVWTPHAELYHYESVSRGVEDTPEKQERFRRETEFMIKKWGSLLKRDPYYNPNLTVKHENFALKDNC